MNQDLLITSCVVLDDQGDPGVTQFFISLEVMDSSAEKDAKNCRDCWCSDECAKQKVLSRRVKPLRRRLRKELRYS